MTLIRANFKTAPQSKPWDCRIEEFDSVAEMRAVIPKRDLNPRVDPSRHDTFGSDLSLDKRWTGYGTSNECFDALTVGVPPDYVMAQIHATQQNIILEQRKRRKQNMMFAPFGGMVAVPRYLAQSTSPMVAMVPQKRNQRVIELGIDMSVSAFVDIKDVQRMGVRIANVILKLDAMGYKTSLKAVNASMFKKNGQRDIYAMSLTVKRFREQFDIGRIYQVIGGTCMTRVLSFGWRARMPEYNGDTSMGTPLCYQFERDDLKAFYKWAFNLTDVYTMQDLINEHSRKSDEEIEDLLVQQLTETARGRGFSGPRPETP